ncbi:hypothetical protein Glove_627g44 [Diversispora epigaea]|uniref:Zn(2)-C6 fungal-type domain-containing protein n=1 Tax=Diversispora epigaea TaxID=1348612 RepID=A0A397GA92_9GLOM|nr:hypothetical protein Glove_627g44 [Diversispora epigaea]
MKFVTITRKEPLLEQRVKIPTDATPQVINEELESYFSMTNFSLIDMATNSLIFKTYESFCDGESYEIRLNSRSSHVKRKTSCEACRQGKRKCERSTNGICARCAKSNKPCKYPSPN